MPEKPRRSTSRARSRVASRRPGTATRLRAGKASGMGGAPKKFHHGGTEGTEKNFSMRDRGRYAKPAKNSARSLDPGAGRDPYSAARTAEKWIPAFAGT